MLDFPLAVKIYIYFLSALCGACAGSFVNCAALRHITGERISRGRSHCPKCGHILSVWELVPVLSWVFLGGKCRKCRERISVRYPLTELILAAAFVTAAARFGLSFITAECWALFSILLAVALIDLDSMEIPNGLLIAGGAVFLVGLMAHEEPLIRLRDGVLTALVIGGVILVISLLMDKLLGRESMGGGDIKLYAMLALFTGPWRGLLLVIASCIIGIAFGLISRAKGREFPFGPSIALAAWPVVLVGNEIVDWYLGLF